ncbi:unnamed protein product [Symbiodinium natans]|uniref:Uncharacterized protein n=1 Tax=Symbiodinium natans TaxID=878477 RepID=A0A812L6V8_9DINO|nr:unnamed protein product [Symbiodinium natans]
MRRSSSSSNSSNRVDSQDLVEDHSPQAHRNGNDDCAQGGAGSADVAETGAPDRALTETFEETPALGDVRTHPSAPDSIQEKAPKASEAERGVFVEGSGHPCLTRGHLQAEVEAYDSGHHASMAMDGCILYGKVHLSARHFRTRKDDKRGASRRGKGSTGSRHNGEAMPASKLPCGHAIGTPRQDKTHQFSGPDHGDRPPVTAFTFCRERRHNACRNELDPIECLLGSHVLAGAAKIDAKNARPRHKVHPWP